MSDPLRRDLTALADELTREGDRYTRYSANMIRALLAKHPEQQERTYDHRDNAGTWVHDDGSDCPRYWSDQPTAATGDPWWCTEHQQYVHVQRAVEALAKAWDEGKRAMLHARVMQGGDDPQNPYRALAEHLDQASPSEHETEEDEHA